MILQRALALHQSQSKADVALVDANSGVEISFGDLVERGTVACARMGLPGGLLILLSRNDVFTVVAYAGSLAAGHAVALLDGASSAESIVGIARSLQSRWLAGPRGTAQSLVERGLPIESVAETEGGELLEVGDAAPPELHPELAVLLSTSGTTGSRKFVRLSRQNIVQNAVAIGEYLGLTPGDRPITSLPLHYTFGLSVLNSHWMAGAAVVLSSDSVMQPTFWDALRANACTSLAGVPVTFQMLERIGFRSMDLPSLTTLQQAGGALDRRLTRLYAEHMAARGGRLFVMYGQTEATARMAYVPPERLEDKLGSAGIAISGGRLRIDPLGPASPAATPVGEVIYEGPNVMLGYASAAEDLARGDDLHGVLRTGDIGYLDEDGYLFLVGRSKRIAKVFGLRINLDEVEAILGEHGPVAVIGGEDVIWAFCAFGTDDSIAALGDTMARRFRLNRKSLRLRRVEELPLSGAGKVDYQQLQEWVR